MNKYQSCRRNGKRMRKHRAYLYDWLDKWGWCKEDAEDYLKRMVVHHINGDKSDNRPCNLRIMTKECHNRMHAAQRKRYKNGRFK